MVFSRIGTTTGVGTIRWKKFTIEQLLVVPPSDHFLLKISKLVELLKANELNYSDFEHETNMLLNTLYGLDKDEISFIENW